jgi:hypothetical protein
MADLKRDIRYINRDFNDFRNALINYSKTYFPNTYNDFLQIHQQVCYLWKWLLMLEMFYLFI